MFKRSIALLAALVVLLPSLPLAGQVLAESSDSRTVSTRGEATVYVTPDEVVVRLGVETFDTSLDKAKQANDAASATLVKAIKGFGVEDKHFQAAALEVSIRYHRENDRGGPSIQGYVANRSYAVTLKDVKRLEEFVEAVIKSGANRLTGIEYRSTELRKHRDQARKLAIGAAREKAAALAGELGCTLGTPRTITEGASDYGDNNFFSGNSSLQAVEEVDGGDVGGETMPLGQIAIRASVSTTFDLVPAAAAPAQPANGDPGPK